MVYALYTTSMECVSSLAVGGKRSNLSECLWRLPEHAVGTAHLPGTTSHSWHQLHHRMASRKHLCVSV